jgi:nitrogen fixation/metabolism regulation signal transduction histidine kinase
VDELALNAEKLAQTERETAWREMARQVAHEIKNPLTPMKLSVQYLKRAWDDKTPDFDQRVKRFSDTMIEQIDSMAEIATAFSDFARMPKAQLEAIKLNELLKSSLSLFDDSPDIQIKLRLSNDDTTVFADNKQLIRVFNNLMKNSMQALEGSHDGHIRVETWREEDTVMVLFADNGPGIPSEQTEKIFAPNFTTKSGGMGLGLAMVKNIVLNHGGQIWFESNGETVFYISLPIFRG